MIPSLPLDYSTLGGGRFIQCACSADPNQTVLILGKCTKIFLAGTFAFQVLYGYMDVNGYLIAPKKYNSANFVRVVIPNGCQPALFSIRDELSTELIMERIHSRLREFVNSPRQVDAFVEECKPISILLINTAGDIASRFIQQQINFNIFTPIGRQLIVGKCLYLTNKEGEDSYMSQEEFESHQRLEECHRQILQRVYTNLAFQRISIVFLVGNKGVGKSTLARFMINALNTGTLEQPPKADCRVFMLDTDVGQSEFCPQGCISLYEVTKPMLGAPFASQLSTLPNSFFFGSNSPSIGCDFYVKLAANLLEKFQKIANSSSDRFVLVVNTVGWIEDLGYDLMIRMLATFKPSLLVNLEMDETLNFTIPQNYWQKTMTVRRQISNSQTTASQRLTPIQLRHCQMVGYLAPLFLHLERRPLQTFRLAELGAPRVRFNSISIYMHPEHNHVDDKFILSALNCSFIGLCKIEDGYEKYFESRHIFDDATLPSKLELRANVAGEDFTFVGAAGSGADAEDILEIETKALPMLRCFGYGLLRAIDPQRKVFYVLTPVDPKVLPQVNVFAYGLFMNTPEMLLIDKNPCDHAPYVVELDNQLQEHHKKLFLALRRTTPLRPAMMRRGPINGKVIAKKN